MTRRYQDGDHLCIGRIYHEARLGLRRLHAEVSITARPFFTRQGFTWVSDHLADINGVTLSNFIMEYAIPTIPNHQ